MKLPPVILPLAGAAALGFALVTVLGQPAQSAREPAYPPVHAPADVRVAGIGIVEPASNIIAIGTELPGLVQDVHVDPGATVRKGDPLFTLDQRDINARIHVLQASLDTAEWQARDATAQYDSVRGISDPRAVAKDDVNRRKFAVDIARGRIEEIKAQIRQAETTRQRMNITAPIDGTILSVDIRAGEYASAGHIDPPLIRMGLLKPLYVRVEIDEENSHQIVMAHTAIAYQRNDNQTALPLTLVRIEPYVRPKQNLAVSGQRVDTRVVQALYALPADQQDMRVGQQLDVFLAPVDQSKGDTP